MPDIRHAATMAEATASDSYDGRLDLSTRDVVPGSTWSRMPEVKCVAPCALRSPLTEPYACS